MCFDLFSLRKLSKLAWQPNTKQIAGQGWRQEFSDGGLTLPTRELKYGFQGTINAKILRKNRFSPSDGGLACSDEGLWPL